MYRCGTIIRSFIYHVVTDCWLSICLIQFCTVRMLLCFQWHKVSDVRQSVCMTCYPALSYCQGIWVEGLRKTHKICSGLKRDIFQKKVGRVMAVPNSLLSECVTKTLPSYFLFRRVTKQQHRLCWRFLLSLIFFYFLVGYSAFFPETLNNFNFNGSR